MKALYHAIDEQRLSREMSWTAVAREIAGDRYEGHPVAATTFKGIKDKTAAEGDGVLQMLLWLHRTPESFIPDFEAAGAEQYHLPNPRKGQVLRWDAQRLHAALEIRRQDLALSWKEVAQAIGGVSPAMLSHLAKGGRVNFPNVMRIVVWLEQPAALFTRLSDE